MGDGSSEMGVRRWARGDGSSELDRELFLTSYFLLLTPYFSELPSPISHLIRERPTRAARH
jgi:hypothetical protein